MTLEAAIRYLRPGASWTLRGESYSGLEWQDQTQIKPTEVEVQAAMLLPEPVPVPQEIPRWALREVCVLRGLIPAIEAALQGLPEPTRTIALNRWHEKPTISRGSPMITALQVLLGWSNDYVDELFRAADQLGS